jgi:hypothetical protein
MWSKSVLPGLSKSVLANWTWQYHRWLLLNHAFSFRNIIRIIRRWILLFFPEKCASILSSYLLMCSSLGVSVTFHFREKAQAHETSFGYDLIHVLSPLQVKCGMMNAAWRALFSLSFLLSSFRTAFGWIGLWVPGPCILIHSSRFIQAVI